MSDFVPVMRGFLEQVKSSCSRGSTNIFLLQGKVVIQEIASSIDKVTINSDTPEIQYTIFWAVLQVAKEKSVLCQTIKNHQNTF